MRKKILRLSCLAIGLAISAINCLAAGSEPQKSAARQINAVRLTQKHFYWGDTEAIISMIGVRINNHGSMKYSLVAASPLWNVTIFRDDDHTYVSQSLQQLEKSGIVSSFVFNRPERNEHQTGQHRTSKIGDMQIEQIMGVREVFAYLPMEGITVPPVLRIIHETYKMPTDGGIPVKFSKSLRGSEALTGMNLTGTIRVYLSTTNIEKIKVSSEIFQPPAGYKLAKSMQEVLLSKNSRDASEDLDQMFDVGTNKAKKHL